MLHALGQFEVAVEALADHRLLVQPGVLHRDRRLVRHAPQEFQILLGKLFAAILRVELNDAERLAFGRTQGHTHHRANAEIDDALAELDAIVAAGVVAEKGLRPLQTAADNGLTGPGVGFLMRPARLDDARQQTTGALLGLDDETTIGLPKQQKQAFDDLGHQGVKVECLAEVGADFEEAAQFLGWLRLQQQVAAVTELGLDGGGTVMLFRLADFVRFGRRGLSLIHERCQEIADADTIVVLEECARGDCHVVDEGAIAALLVFNVVASLDAEDDGMFATDRCHRDHDAAVRIASEDELVAVQRDEASLVGSFKDVQCGHCSPPGVRGRQRGRRAMANETNF